MRSRRRRAKGGRGSKKPGYLDARGVPPTKERRARGAVVRSRASVGGELEREVWRAGGRDWLRGQCVRGNLTKRQFAAALGFEDAYAAHHVTESIRSALDPDAIAARMADARSAVAATGMTDRRLAMRRTFADIQRRVGASGVRFLEAVIVEGRRPRDVVPELTGVDGANDKQVAMGYLRLWLNEVSEILS